MGTLLVRVIALIVVALGLIGCESNGADPTTRGSGVATTTAGSTVSTSLVTTTQSNESSVPFDNSKWIASQGWAPGGSEGIVLLRPDGSEIREVQAPENLLWLLPDWSPTGERLVVTSRGGFPELLYEYDLATDSSTPLFECSEPCGGDDEPAYSPDGSHVLFIRYLGPLAGGIPSDCSLWIGDLATLETTMISTNENCDREYSPRFSPDGERIAYFRWRDAGPEKNAVFVVDSGGGEEEQLTEWDLAAGYPDWSPNGEWIVFSSNPDWDVAAVSNLYRMRPDGTEVEQLTFYDETTFRASQPRYSPDGEWILFTGVKPEGRDVMAIPADGGEPIAIITGSVYTHNALQP